MSRIGALLLDRRGLCRLMSQVGLLKSLPKLRRDVKARAEGKNEVVVALSKRYGYDYFDGNRLYGYGGYHYDGRWKTVAHDILGHYFSDSYEGGRLSEPRRIVDIGCAKGFLVHDLWDRGADAYGLDVSN